MKHYTVFGNPIAHSKSPEIHQQFAAQEGVQIDYTRTLVENSATAFAAAVQNFFANGGSGANVTLPFKQHAFDLCDVLSERAQVAGAVNTLMMGDDGRLWGDNTDGIGLVRDLCQVQKWTLADKRVLILGAGGAARGVILPLLQCQPHQMVIANRTAQKAVQLAEQFGIVAQTFVQLAGQFDVVINATSGSVSGDLPPIAPDVVKNACVYDMFYAAQKTVFLQWATQQGARKTADGLGMLVGQAAAAYELWRGFVPDVAPVLVALRGQM